MKSESYKNTREILFFIIRTLKKVLVSLILTRFYIFMT